MLFMFGMSAKCNSTRAFDSCHLRGCVSRGYVADKISYCSDEVGYTTAYLQVYGVRAYGVHERSEVPIAAGCVKLRLPSDC